MADTSRTIAIEVPDDSIVANKELTIRPIGKMKLKHLRAFQRVVAAGKNANMDDMAQALAGVLIGWSEDEIEELSLDEMLMIIGKLGEMQQSAIPNASGSPSPQHTQRIKRGRARTG